MDTKKCNVCGKEFKDEGNHAEFHHPELHRFVINFEYGSDFDNQTWEFYKCNRCLVEEVENFVVLPKIENLID